MLLYTCVFLLLCVCGTIYACDGVRVEWNGNGVHRWGVYLGVRGYVRTYEMNEGTYGEGVCKV